MMQTEKVIAQVAMEVSEKEREFVFLRKSEAKLILERVNSLERHLADLLRSAHGKAKAASAV